jgi:uncharacterized protein (UPF0335 family)
MPKKEPTTGHNSGVSSDELKSLVSRIERLEGEKAELAVDIREVFAEAKSKGFDTKALRRLLARRKLSSEEREERDYVDELYQGVFS